MKKALFSFAFLALFFFTVKAERDTLRVYFDSGTDEISGFQQSLIDIFASTHYAQGEIIVSGHTDDLGDSKSNLEFARKRAKLVAEYLLTQGIQSDKMVLEAWGETKPLYPNVSAYNRARNRRVEIIGIPNPEKSILTENFPDETPLKLENGASVRYRQMTTAAGNARRLWVIRLAKDGADFIPPASGFWNGWTRLMNCLQYRIDAMCPPGQSYTLAIPTTENMRCPLSEIEFDNAFINATKQNFQQSKTVLEPVLTDSGYAFVLTMPDYRNCYPSEVALGKKCYTTHEAVIRLEKLRLKSLRGNIKDIATKVDAKAIDENRLQMTYINDDPSTTIVYGTLVKGKRRRMNLKAMPLNQLPKDETTGEYILSKKLIKALKKRRRHQK